MSQPFDTKVNVMLLIPRGTQEMEVDVEAVFQWIKRGLTNGRYRACRDLLEDTIKQVKVERAKRGLDLNDDC